MDSTIETTTMKVEDMRPGYRYWAVRPGFEDAWTIKSVEIRLADYEVDRGEGWFTPTVVIVTRNDGNVRHFELGDEIAIMGPYPSAVVSNASIPKEPKAPAEAFTGRELAELLIAADHRIEELEQLIEQGAPAHHSELFDQWLESARAARDKIRGLCPVAA